MQPGAVFADRYRIERVAGEGGMATVYRARDVETDEIVALKLLLTPGAEEIERFTREADTLAGLRHAGVVGYRSHGLLGETSYLAMEWLEGETLAHRLKRSTLSVAETVSVARQVADALGAVHARGTIHRDIKPGNLFLCDGTTERVKLLDFGIVRLQISPKAVTRAGFAIGTPGYMAPEQASGSPHVGPGADIFSLGCVLFECLTGRPAFEGEHLLAVLAKVLLQDPPAAGKYRRDVPKALSALISRMLAKKAENRPPDAAAVLQELDALDLELPVETPRLDAMSQRPPPLSQAPSSWSPSSRAPVSRALTQQEQRLVSVLIVGADGSEIAASSANKSDTQTAQVGLVPLIAEHGGRFAWLADGTLVATMAGAFAATDQAVQTAKCALAVRAAFPGRPITIAMGRGSFGDDGENPVGEAIERAIKLLTAERSRLALAADSLPETEPIPIDGLTAGLIDAEFDVDAHDGSYFLRARRSEGGGMRVFLGKATPYVGRERELRMLDGLFEEVSSESVARAVLVTAPPGTGKSRLQFELTRRIKSRAEVWIARGDPMRGRTAFGLLGQIVRQTAGLYDGDPLEVRRQHLEARTARHVDPDRARRVAEFLGEMVGTPFAAEDSLQLRAARHDARLLGDQMQRAWMDFLEVECRAHPVVLIFEDLHWGDQSTVDSVDRALRLLRDLPLMVFALARPEVHDRFPTLWRDRSLTEIRLDPLSRKACEKLVRAVLGPHTSAETVSRLWEQSTGNPFFLEELLRSAAEGREESTPRVVMAMLQSRMERLPAEERRVLRAGSVLGRTFWSGAVAALIGDDPGASRLEEHLGSLEKGEWIIRSASSAFPDETEHVFHHELVRDSAYDMLTDEDRRLGHKLAGEWLEAMGSTDATLLAEHYARGGERIRAAVWYGLAAEQALGGNDLQAAVVRAERAAENGAEGEALGALRLLQAVAYRWRGEQADARRCSLEAMRLLPRGSARWIDAACEAGVADATQGDLGMLSAISADVEHLLAEGEIGGSQAVAAARLARRLIVGGLLEAADSLLEKVELGAQAALAEDPAAQAWLLNARAIRAYCADEPWVYLSLSQAAMAAFEAAGDERNLTDTLGSVGYAYMQLGMYEKAEEALRQSIAMSERLGLSPGFWQHNLGLLLAHLGRLDEALDVESIAIQDLASGNSRRAEGFARLYLSRILALLGRLDEAAAASQRAAEVIGEANERVYVLGTMAYLCLQGGRAAEALRYAEEAMDRVRARPGTLGEGEAFIRLAHAEALLASGDRAGAASAITSAADRILSQAARIADTTCREAFLSRIPEHMRTLSLAREAPWAG